MDAFAQLLRVAADKYGSIFVTTWTFPPDQYWPLGLSSKPNFGASDVARANIRLADAIADLTNVHLVDLAQLQSAFPKAMYDARLNMIGRMRFTPDFLKYVAERMQPLIEATVRPSKKIIICDLDNTLWGGIVAMTGSKGCGSAATTPLAKRTSSCNRCSVR